MKKTVDPANDSEVEELHDEVFKLRQEIATMKETKSSRKKATKGDDLKDDWQLEIDRIMKEDLWNGGNFKILWEKSEIRTLQKRVFANMKPHLKEQFKNLDDFIDTYGKDVPTALNALRQYVQQNVKKVVDQYMLKNGLKMPTAEDMRKIIGRDFTTKDTKMMKLYQWYWDSLLPQVVGNTFDWHPRNRHFRHLSSARHGDDCDEDGSEVDEDAPKQPYLVTPSTEVMAVMFLDNHRATWEYQIAKKVADENYNAKAKDDNKPEEKWTTSHCGRAATGGWSQKPPKEGEKTAAEIFKDLKGMNHIGRAAEGTEELDAKCLENLKKARNITASTYDEMSSKKRKRNKEVVVELTEEEEEERFGE